jgi:hypothetical protein
MAVALPPRITHEPHLVLSEATQADLLGINDIFYEGFQDPFILRMFPNTPGIREWWAEANGNDMLNRAADRYLVMKDMAADERFVGYAKWQCPTGDHRSEEEFFPRFPPWHSDSDAEFNDRFFDAIKSARLNYYEEKGEKQHYC